jgi:Kef-type K+ transport system membrane component KefB
MPLDLTILIDIAVILIGAKIFGEIAERLKFPVLLGELVAGLVIGGLMLVKPNDFMSEIASFGVLFLFFMLGLAMKVDDIKKQFKPAFFITIGGTLVSFLLGFLFGYFLFSDAVKGLFVGIAVMSSSTTIALKMLHDSGELNTKLYNLASFVSRLDDLLAVLMITVLTSVILMGLRLELVFLSLVLVIIIFLVLEKWLSAPIGKAIEIFKQLNDEYMLIAIALVIVFVASFLVEKVGIGGAIGAFLAGYALSKSRLTEQEIIPKMKTIGYGFFIPVFFTYAAVSVDLGAAYSMIGYAIVLFVLAALAKFIGTALLAKWEGHSGNDVRKLGIAMIPRGEYAIAVAYIALFSHFVDKSLYSMIIVFVLLTIIITPLVFRISRRKDF